MESDSPLAAIARWVRAQDEAIQDEIAGLLAFLMFEEDGYLASIEKQREAMLTWLNYEGLSFRTIGRALMFKSCLEHACRKRFSEEGWEENAETFRSVISEGSSDHESDAAQIAPSAFRMLRQLPERKEAWLAVGRTWDELMQEHLSEEALNTWSIVQMARRPEPPHIVGN